MGSDPIKWPCGTRINYEFQADFSEMARFWRKMQMVDPSGPPEEKISETRIKKGVWPHKLTFWNSRWLWIIERFLKNGTILVKNWWFGEIEEICFE